MLDQFRVRLRALLQREATEAELDEELRFHLGRETERNRARGMNAEEATAAARRAFGNVDTVKESARETWAWRALDDLTRDLRFAFRSLRLAPVLYAVVIAVLAIGIGMNAAVYSVFRAFAVQTLPVPQAESLFRLRGGEASPSGAPTMSSRMSVPDYRDIRTRVRTVTELAAFVPARAQVELNGTPRAVTADFVSGNYFATLRMRALRGRLLRDEDDKLAAPTANAVISEAIWRADFGARSDVLGQIVRLGGSPVTIVGVISSPFIGLSADQPANMWMPMGMYDAVAVEPGLLDARDFPTAMVFGRRPNGISNPAIASEVERIGRDLSQEYPAYHQRFRLEVSDGSRLLEEGDAGQSLRVLALVWAVLLAIHLIACSNVASVLIARAIARRPEIATRLALGASRTNIIRQLMVESFLLATIAVALGIGLAIIALTVLARTPLFAAFDLRVDVPVLGAAIGVGIVTAFLFGLMPALESARTNLMSVIKGGGGDRQGGRGNRTSIFVTVQLVLSVVLLTMTGLALRAVRTATNTNPGYDVEHLMFANLSVSDSGRSTPATGAAKYQALRAGVAAVSGVRAVAEAQDIPLSTHQMSMITVVPGYAYGPHESNRVGFDNVSPGYFAAMGIPIVHGQDFDASRYGDSAYYNLHNLVVNEAFAKRYWPGRDAIGQQVLFKGRTPVTVIGVVSDTRDKSLLAPGEPRVFIALPSPSYITLVVRTTGRSEAIAPMVRERIANLGLGITRPSIILGKDVRGQSLRAARIVSGGLTVLTSLALGLAALGLYALVAFTMERRTREIGLRLALGARSSDIYSLASAITFRPAAIGLIAGSAIAIGLARVAASLVAGAGALDLPILLGTVGALAAVVALSALIPARRALRIEPIIALRNT